MADVGSSDRLEAQIMEIWVGTSGYSYSDWVGSFYPPGSRAGSMFGYYATRFPLVELNFTFYRLPSSRDLAAQAERAPAGFQFLVKLHQSLTHEWKLGEAAEFRKALEPMQQGECLLGVLAQFPQRFHHTRTNVERLGRLADAFDGVPMAVEFRHASWARREVYDWLSRRGLHLVSVDVPPIPQLFPTGLVQTSRWIYVRFHSRVSESWYESDKERYDYLYSDAELTDWLNALAARAPLADRALLLFNNCRRGQAAANAERIRQLIHELNLPFQVIPPFARPPDQPRQRDLFGD